MGNFKQPTKLNLGQRIKELRERQVPRMSQADLAKAIGKSRTQVTHYESDYSDPSTKTLMKIADALNVSFFQFFISDQEHKEFLKGKTDILRGKVTKTGLLDTFPTRKEVSDSYMEREEVMATFLSRGEVSELLITKDEPILMWFSECLQKIGEKLGVELPQPPQKE